MHPFTHLAGVNWLYIVEVIDVFVRAEVVNQDMRPDIGFEPSSIGNGGGVGSRYMWRPTSF
jgi:hypothetical protein